MQYMLLIHVNEAGWPTMSKAEQEQGMAAYAAYTEALKKAGVLVNSNRLQPSSTAAVIRSSNGKPQVLDGPFADSKEQLGGYYLIDVPISIRPSLGLLAVRPQVMERLRCARFGGNAVHSR